MKTINAKNMYKPLIALVMAVFGGSAFADSNWSLTACSSNQNLGTSATCADPGGAAGLTLSGLSNGAGSSYSPSATNNSTSFKAASIYDWGSSSGLGVVSGNETSVPDGPHAIDNGYGIDALLLNFTSGAVNMTGLTIGWNGNDNWARNDNNGSSSGGGSAITYNDSDLSVFAWTGTNAPTVTSTSPTGLTTANSGWTLIGNYANVGLNSGNKAPVVTSIYSSYWLISAYSSAYGSGTGLNQGNDSFKVLALAGNTCSGTVIAGSCVNTPTNNNVPEPGSLALLGLGLIGLVASRRSPKID